MKQAYLISIFITFLACSHQGSGQHLSQEDARSDFIYLRNKIAEIHPNRFFFRSPEEEETHFQHLHNKIDDSMDLMSFYQLVAAYTTFFQDGHTFPSMSFLSRRYEESLREGNTVIPLLFDFKEEELFILHTSDNEQYVDLIGQQLLGLNGHSSQKIIEAFQTYYAKRASHLDNAHIRLFNAYFWAAFGSYSDWDLEYLDESGKRKSVHLSGLSKRLETPQANNANGMLPPFQFDYIFDNKAGLLTINYMADPQGFEEFAEDLFQQLNRKKIKHLVIDMRQNGGGTSQIGDILYSYLSDKAYSEGKMYVKTSPTIKHWYESDRKGHPLYEFVQNGKPNELLVFPDTTLFTPVKREFLFEGKSYLLTSKKTYSSGHMFAGLFKCGNIGTMIGQETGQATKTVGDAFSFTLPHSEIDISVSYKIFEGPCELSFEHGFQPDITISYEASEVKDGIDKEMLFIRELIQKQ